MGMIVGKKSMTNLLPDYRFILWETMMEDIWLKIDDIGMYKFKNETFVNDILRTDIGRTLSWMRLLAHDAHNNLEFDRNRRPALF